MQMVFSILVAFALDQTTSDQRPACQFLMTVQGEQLHCCVQPNGQRCCAQTLAEDGTIPGCACAP